MFLVIVAQMPRNVIGKQIMDLVMLNPWHGNRREFHFDGNQRHEIIMRKLAGNKQT